MVTLAAVAPFACSTLVNRFYWLRASTVLALGMLVIMGQRGGHHRHPVQPPVQPDGPPA